MNNSDLIDTILEYLNKHPFLTGMVSIILLIVVGFLGWFEGNNSYLSICGTIITVLGFMLTIFQLKSVKTIAKNTDEKVDRTVDFVQGRIKEITSISECVAANQIINEVEHYISDDKLEIAVILLKEVYKTLVSIRSDKTLLTVVPQNIQEITLSIKLDIDNLQDFIHNGSIIEKSKIFPNLRNASELLIEIENYLKNKDYDTSILK